MKIEGKMKFHWWRCQSQFRSIFDERHEIGRGICTNARNTAGLCGQILSCCFDLIVYITKISKHWEFAPIAWLCPWRSYIILSEFVVFVENGTKLNLTTPSMDKILYAQIIRPYKIYRPGIRLLCRSFFYLNQAVI